MINKRDTHFRAGAIITGIMVLIILIGIFWTPYDPNAMDGTAKMQAPSMSHILGTDNFGRDIFSRIVQGAGSTFLIAAATVAIGLVIGILLGSITGYYGGWMDEVLMRINDSILAFPSILLALVIIALMGGGKYNIIIALGILFIPSFARLVVWLAPTRARLLSTPSATSTRARTSNRPRSLKGKAENALPLFFLSGQLASATWPFCIIIPRYSIFIH